MCALSVLVCSLMLSLFSLHLGSHVNEFVGVTPGIAKRYSLTAKSLRIIKDSLSVMFYKVFLLVLGSTNL